MRGKEFFPLSCKTLDKHDLTTVSSTLEMVRLFRMILTTYHQCISERKEHLQVEPFVESLRMC